MVRPSSVTRTAVAILVTVVSLLLALLVANELLGDRVTALLGLVLAGVAPKMVDVVQGALPATPLRFRTLLSAPRGLLARLLPALPPQEPTFHLWTAATALLLVQGADLPSELISAVLNRIDPYLTVPMSPWEIFPLAVLHYPVLALAGYLIGRLDPARTAKNVALALYVNLFILLLGMHTPSEFYELLWVVGMEEGFSPLSNGAVFVVAGTVAMEATVRTLLTLLGALWGARHASVAALRSGEGDAV